MMGLLLNVGVLVLAAHAVTSLNDEAEGQVTRLVPRSILPPSEKPPYLQIDEIHHYGNEMSPQGLPFPATPRRKRCTQYGCSQYGDGGYRPYSPIVPVLRPSPGSGCVGYGCPRDEYGYGGSSLYGGIGAARRGW